MNFKFTKQIGLAGTALALVLFAGGAVAQEGRHHRGNPAARIEALKTKLGLTDAQAESVKQIFADSAAQTKAIFEKYPKTEGQKGLTEAARTELKQLREQTHAKLATVLDAEQLKKFDAARKHHGRKPHARFDTQKMVDRQITAMKTNLQLSDTQAESVKNILQESHREFAALRGKADGQSREAFAKIRQDTHTKLAQVLDAQQLAKYDAWRQEMGKRFSRHNRAQ
jgi:hypothetical protein